MEAVQVSDHANNARNDDPQCLEPTSLLSGFQKKYNRDLQLPRSLMP